jgi:hypothetical protein
LPKSFNNYILLMIINSLGASASESQQIDNPIWGLIYAASNTYSKTYAKKVLRKFFIKSWANHRHNTEAAPSWHQTVRIADKAVWGTLHLWRISWKIHTHNGKPLVLCEASTNTQEGFLRKDWETRSRPIYGRTVAMFINDGPMTGWYMM